MILIWSYLYFLFVEILTLLMRCFPDLSEHIYDFYFEFYFLDKSIISCS